MPPREIFPGTPNFQEELKDRAEGLTIVSLRLCETAAVARDTMALAN